MKLALISAIVSLFSLYGCLGEKPVPPEVKLAETQEMDLWRAEVSLYLPDEYNVYKLELRKAKESLIKETSRIRWLRDYTPVKAQYLEVLRRGEELFKKLEEQKKRRAEALAIQIKRLEDRIRNLEKTSPMVSALSGLRINFTKAEVVLNESKLYHQNRRYIEAEKLLREAEDYLREADKGITPILSRYSDPQQILRWRKLAYDAIEESRSRGICVIVVVKAERKLLLYSGGKLLRTYGVGLGKNGLLDKRRARDLATPEGRYRIIRKNPNSKFYKALLINYPNEEDIREFRAAKKKGLISPGASIGGLIEIHGGGDEALTDGCISLDNPHMEELYRTVDVGTPVVIVGALKEQNSVTSMVDTVHNAREQKKSP